MTRLEVIRVVVVVLALVFEVVFVGCWVRYGVRLARGRWLGRDGRRRRGGEQPLCEFTEGPVGNGLFWHDAVLDQVVGEFERELGAGGGLR